MDLIDKRDLVLRTMLEHGVKDCEWCGLRKSDLAECAEQIVEKLTIPVVSSMLILTPKDAEIFFNEVMNPKHANEALKKAMLKFITR